MVLIVLLGAGAIRKARQVQREVTEVYERDRRTERVLDDIRTDLNSSGVYLRDYLLDPSHISASYYRDQLLSSRQSLTLNLDALQKDLADEDLPQLGRLRDELETYWDTIEPLFEWTPQQKIALSYSFLRSKVLPRRNVIVEITREIRALNEASLRRREQALRDSQRRFRLDLAWMLGFAVALGIAVAAISILRISYLERRAAEQRTRTERAERELRQLSHQLVRLQEEERKAISRELHDQVGQMLTALRMELTSIERHRGGPDEVFGNHVAASRQLAEDTLRAVRDLSLGLRPSMLDDLGLGAALEWQAREFSRRSGVAVNVISEGDLDSLSDQYRTCVFRVVQEALTNCARHAHARQVRIGVHAHAGSLYVAVEDDGVGVAKSDHSGGGLGLIGIEERVRELGGSLEVFSQPGRGTALKVRLPVPVASS